MGAGADGNRRDMLSSVALRRSLPRVSSSLLSRSVHIEKRIADLGHELPAVTAPKGSYCLFNRVGNLIFTAGHLPMPASGEWVCACSHRIYYRRTSGDLLVGKVGADMSVDDGYEAAKYAALSMCASLKEEIGDLDKVKRLVKVSTTPVLVLSSASFNPPLHVLGRW